MHGIRLFTKNRFINIFKEENKIMAKINHLDMGAEVLALDDVQVKKGFMGLTIKLIYKPTNSTIKIKEKEYSAEDGKKLISILNSAPNEVESSIKKFPVSAISMGNMKLQACLSDDHQFVATQLLAFKDFGYQPVTEMVTYTGKTAEAFAQLF
jgi:hypothetical protein